MNKLLFPVLQFAKNVSTKRTNFPISGRIVLQKMNLKPFALNIRSFGATASAEPFLDPKDVTDRVIQVVKNFEKVSKSKVTATARFKEDLDLDSLDAVEIVMAVEEEFCIEIPDSEADKIFSIADAVAFVSTHPMAK